MADGAFLDLGEGVRLTAVATPGHSAGHLAFLLEEGVGVDRRRATFSGDALFPGGLILLQDTWDCDIAASLRSVERLAELDADDLLAGHLAPALGDARDHAAIAAGPDRRAAATGEPALSGGLAPEALDALLRETIVARLATIDDDGYPYVVPVWTEWDGSAMWLVARARAAYVAHLTARPKVALVGRPGGRRRHAGAAPGPGGGRRRPRPARG